LFWREEIMSAIYVSVEQRCAYVQTNVKYYFIVVLKPSLFHYFSSLKIQTRSTMSTKRKHSDLDDGDITSIINPRKYIRHTTITVDRGLVKRQKKKNSFHVDNLLAEKTPVEVVGCDDSRRASSDDTRPSPSVTPPTPTKTIESAFHRVYRKDVSLPSSTHTSQYLRRPHVFRRVEGPRIYNDPYKNYGNVVVKSEPVVQDDAKPLSAINFTKYPAKIHTYRSRESGSADSEGSSCNSYEHLVGEQERYRKHSYEGEYSVDTLSRGYNEELRFPYEYKRSPADYQYLRNTSSLSLIQKNECSCLDCDSNRQKQYNKGRWTKRPTNIIYMESRIDYKEPTEYKPFSKRKALLNELEFCPRDRVVGECYNDERPRVPPIQIKKEKLEDEEEENENFVSKNSPTDAKVQMKSNNEELLKASIGQNRNRAVANLLERRRVAELNCAFERLRTLIPSYGNEDRTLSKIKTLKYALTYMTHLMRILSEQNHIGYFNVDKDFKKLTVQDPLIQKCREHMCVKKIF